MQDSAWILVMSHSLMKYLARSINHKRAASTFLYNEFPNSMKYSLGDYSVMVPRYTIPSGHPMNISNDIYGCINANPVPHIVASHIFFWWNKVIPIRVHVYVPVATSKNESL